VPLESTSTALPMRSAILAGKGIAKEGGICLGRRKFGPFILADSRIITLLVLGAEPIPNQR
jgi:hypothetical protein